MKFLVLGAALLLHGWFFFASPQRRVYDSTRYLTPAASLAEGRGFLDRDGAPEIERTPGYPLFLAPLVRACDDAIVAIQHLLVLGAAFGMFVYLRRRLDEWTAALAAMLFGIDAAVIVSTNVVMTEALFVVVLMIATMLVMTAIERGSVRWTIGAAIAVGALPLIRPIAMWLLVPLALVFLIRRRVVLAIVFAILAAMPPLAWVARNERVSGVRMLTSLGGVNMLYFRAAGALAMEELPGFVFSPTLEGEKRYADVFYRRVQRELVASVAYADALPAAQRSQVYGRRGAQIVMEHPIGYAKSALNGTLHLLFDPMRDFAWAFPHPLSVAIVVLLAISAIAIVVGTILGAFALRRRDPLLLAVALAGLAYFLLMSAGPEATFETVRFRVPLVPFTSLLAACALRRSFPARAV